MKWMVIIGFACAVVGGLYRWLVTPSDPEKWGLLDVGLVMIGLGGVAFFVVGLILLGVKQVFR
ncbi:MAG: hypothetical protein JO133_07950 [Burkholderiaceae bacterium]|nr:hypothetical protein [Burkholderiaceae bacterium]